MQIAFPTWQRAVAVAAAAAAAALALSPAAALAQQHANATVNFVNGGITEDEANELRAQARSYPLEIRFAQRTDLGNAFAADVHVRILDASGRQVLVLPAAEPILLANLPPGHYTVEATYEGQTKRQQVAIGRGHQKLGFQW